MQDRDLPVRALPHVHMESQRRHQRVDGPFCPALHLYPSSVSAAAAAERAKQARWIAEPAAGYRMALWPFEPADQAQADPAAFHGADRLQRTAALRERSADDRHALFLRQHVGRHCLGRRLSGRRPPPGALCTAGSGRSAGTTAAVRHARYRAPHPRSADSRTAIPMAIFQTTR